MDRLRKPPRNGLQVLHHTRTGPIHVRAIFKNNEHIGIVEHGLRADCLNVRRGQQGSHDWIGNLILDDIGRLAFPIGMDDYLHIGNVRQRVQWDVAHSPDTTDHQ